jgi:hypothetical protein
MVGKSKGNKQENKNAAALDIIITLLSGSFVDPKLYSTYAIFFFYQICSSDLNYFF